MQYTRKYLGMTLAVVSVMLAFASFSGTADAATSTLTWTEPAADATHSDPTEFDVYRSTDSSICADTTKALAGPVLSLTVAAARTFVDSTVPNVNGVVCYEVEAKNAGGVARSSRVSKATTVNPPFAPTAAIQ